MEQFQSFLSYRKKLFLRLLVLLLLASLCLKFMLTLVNYVGSPYALVLSDVAGMSLTDLVAEASWEKIIYVGVTASLCVAITSGLLLWLGGEHGNSYTYTSGGKMLLWESLALALLLSATAFIGGLGVEASKTIAALFFAPLFIFSMANPEWSNKGKAIRAVLGVSIALVAFVFVNYKSILLYLFVAYSFGAFYKGTSRIIYAVVVLSAAVVYPYLNVLRYIFKDVTPDVALGIVGAHFIDDLNEHGVIQMLASASDMLLDRLVGFDGLVVASAIDGSVLSRDLTVGYQLLGVDNVGISVGLLGQLLLQTGSFGLAVVAYPLVVLATWRIVIMLDKQLIGLGFASCGSFLYLKATILLIEGFRVVEMLLTGATIIAVVIIGAILMFVKKVIYT